MSKMLFDNEPAAKPEIATIAPWFGSNRMLSHAVGEELQGCKWVGIAFAGGMSEVLHIKAGAIVVNDVHRLVINMARVIADPTMGLVFYRRVKRLLFHPDVLAKAQKDCEEWQHVMHDEPHLAAAVAYFVACWMNRSALAGTDSEFRGKLPVRWTTSGGDSAVRCRSAVKSVIAWRRVFPRCNFSTDDVFEFLPKCKDTKETGLYLDPPFPGPGDDYRHKFTEAQHRRMAFDLSRFRSARIVCRFYDHPLVRELYPEGRWSWRRLKGRDQTNDDEKPEVLIVNGKLRGAA